MDVKGFIDVSFVDWDGKVTSVIFLPNCNFRCPFCHNVNLVLNPEKIETIPFEYIEDQLLKHKKWIDGVCVSGGEPTLHNYLPELLSKIKKMGFKTKLDTNGTNPKMLRELLDQDLVDYVALDVKAPLNVKSYSSVVGVKVNNLLKKVKESIKILMESGIEYEFRTTIVPTLHDLEDIRQICLYLKNCRKFVIQRFDVSIGQSIIDPILLSKTMTEKEIQEFFKTAKEIISNVKVR